MGSLNILLTNVSVMPRTMLGTQEVFNTPSEGMIMLVLLHGCTLLFLHYCPHSIPRFSFQSKNRVNKKGMKKEILMGKEGRQEKVRGQSEEKPLLSVGPVGSYLGEHGLGMILQCTVGFLVWVRV